MLMNAQRVQQGHINLLQALMLARIAQIIAFHQVSVRQKRIAYAMQDIQGQMEVNVYLVKLTNTRTSLDLQPALTALCIPRPPLAATTSRIAFATLAISMLATAPVTAYVPLDLKPI